MPYEKPYCCGATLTVFAEISIATLVRRDGTPSLSGIQIFKTKPSLLLCHYCRAQYLATLDSKKRIIKGKLIGG